MLESTAMADLIQKYLDDREEAWLYLMEQEESDDESSDFSDYFGEPSCTPSNATLQNTVAALELPHLRRSQSSPY
jgi:hypothetical protein